MAPNGQMILNKLTCLLSAGHRHVEGCSLVTQCETIEQQRLCRMGSSTSTQYHNPTWSKKIQPLANPKHILYTNTELCQTLLGISTSSLCHFPLYSEATPML